MLKASHKITLFLILITLTSTTWLKAQIIDKINIEGNKRISSETIIMFTGVSISDDLNEGDLNDILKKLYDTDFFDLVSVKILSNTLIIKVKENPII